VQSGFQEPYLSLRKKGKEAQFAGGRRRGIIKKKEIREKG